MTEGSPEDLATMMRIFVALENVDRLNLLILLNNEGEPIGVDNLAEKVNEQLGMERNACIYHLNLLLDNGLARFHYPTGYVITELAIDALEKFLSKKEGGDVKDE